MRKISAIVLVVNIALLLTGSYQSQAATGERYFPDTGHSIVGAFKSYWEQHGGLERFGYPLSDELAEVSDLNGQTYTVQYFERAEFEHHPENAALYDVLLTQLGTLRYHQKYPNGAATEQVSTDSPTLFSQTGKHVGRLLLNAWQRLGGLANVGYPISEELAEQSPLDGKIYLVQYFERAEFEYHPENQPPYDVLLTQLGRFAYTAKYNAPIPTPVAPTPTPNTSPFPLDEGITSGPIVVGSTVFWANGSIFGYTDTGEKFTVSSVPGAVRVLAGDGRTLIWGEIFNGQAIIHAYDTYTRQETNAFTYPGYNGEGFQPLSFAVSNETLYYSHSNAVTKGFSLFARNLISGQEQVVKDNGVGPLISDGYLLWHESVCHGHGSFACAPPELFIYARKLDGSAKDVVIDLGGTEQPLSGYGIYNGNVIWGMAYFGGVFSRALSGGPIQTIFSGSAQASAVSGNKVAWVNSGLRQDATQYVMVYDMDSGVTTTITSFVNKFPIELSLSHDVLAYRLNDGVSHLDELYVINLSAIGLASNPLQLSAQVNSSPPAVASHNLFWLDAKCDFCGYDVDKGEHYTVPGTQSYKVNIVGNSKEVAWLEASPTSRGDIHAYSPTTNQESTIMYADGYNVIEFALTNDTIYYRGTLNGKPGIYQRNRATGVDTPFLPSAGIGILVSSESALVWSEVKDSVATIHLHKSDGSINDQIIARNPGGVGYYNISGDNVVWVEPFNPADKGARIHLYNISSGSDKVLASGSVDRPVISGNRVAWINTTGGSKPWMVVAYSISTGASDVAASDDKTPISDIALADDNALAYTVDVGGGGGLYLVSLK